MQTEELQSSYVRPSRAGSLLVAAVLLFYTTGFYVYSLLVFYGMPAYLRGFLVIGASICIPILALPYFKVLLHPASRRMIDVIMWLMLAYFLAWMLAIDAQSSSPVEFNGYLGTIISWTMLFMLGRLVPFCGEGLSRLALIVFVMLFVLTLANTENGAFIPAQSPTTYATYQAYAVVLSIVTFVLLYKTKDDILFMMIAVTAIISFAILGSRSELVAMVFSSFIIANLRRISAAAIALQIFAASILYGAYILLTSKGWNRLANMVEEGAESTLSARADAFVRAMDTILIHPFSGDFGSYVAGLYAHNLLSVWVDFGIIGIGLYALLLVVSLFGLLFCVPSPLKDRKNVVVIALWAFCALLLVLTKSGSYFVVPFVMGLIATHISIASQAHKFQHDDILPEEPLAR
jgi:hypothetical protein